MEPGNPGAGPCRGPSDRQNWNMHIYAFDAQLRKYAINMHRYAQYDKLK